MQMEFNNRTNEVKGQAKLTDISIEELVHKATVEVSDLKYVPTKKRTLFSYSYSTHFHSLALAEPKSNK